MTLTTQTQRWEYVGDGSTTTFGYDARVDLASDMKAFLNGVPSDISFIVIGLGNDTGGEVIFNTAPALDVAISLERILPFQQTTDFPVRGPFPAEANEGTFDRIVMMLQQTRTNLIDIQDYLGIGVGGGGEIFPIGGQVPPGLIAEWAGAIADIPNGWFLCDGANNTPNLSGRFIAAVDEGALPGEFATIGEQGGANSVALTTNEMPNHTHVVSPTGVDGLVTPPPGGSTTSGGSESRADIVVEGVTGHSQPVGTAEAHNNVPLYYTLAYIQFQGGSLPPSFVGSIPDAMFLDNETITPIDVSGQFFVGDGTNPVYTASGLPVGLSIDPVTGIISGTVDANASASSPYSVTVQLTTSINPPATSFPVATWSVLDSLSPPVAGFSIWLDPNQIVDDAVNITAWPNDSGASAGAAADMTVAGAPIPISTQNGFPVAESVDATQKSLVAATPFIIPTGFTVFAVGRIDLSSPNSSLIDMDATPGDRVLFNTTTQDLGVSGDDAGVLTTLVNDSLPHVFAGRFDAANHRARISGQVSWTDDPDVSPQPWNYGKLLQTFTANNVQVIGWIGELLVYPVPLSDADMATVFDHLTAKWGL